MESIPVTRTVLPRGKTGMRLTGLPGALLTWPQRSSNPLATRHPAHPFNPAPRPFQAKPLVFPLNLPDRGRLPALQHPPRPAREGGRQGLTAKPPGRRCFTPVFWVTFCSSRFTLDTLTSSNRVAKHVESTKPSPLPASPICNHSVTTEIGPPRCI